MNIKTIAYSATFLGMIGAASPAAAQTVALATTQGGATEQIANAIAMVVTEQTTMQIRPQMSANTAQYIPMVNAGRLEFGIANYPQTFYAIQGTGMSEGTPNPDLRIVGTLFPFTAGLFVTEDSGMTSYTDLEGVRVPRYPDNSLGDYIIRAGLAAGGLTYDDVESVPIANFPRQYDAMRQRQIDVAIATAGAQPTFDMEASLGGIRFLSFSPDDDETIAEFLPGTYTRTLPEGFHSLPGLSAESRLFAYDYMLFAHRDVSDEIVAQVVNALYNGADQLRETSPLWQEYNPDDLAKMTDMPSHEGALAVYRELGLID
ncbi:MAG: TAXI family TRAP transporter solute-binding subunit [Pararhodobacter sp.]|nr:TAXI family TRAP transporter solute-binding subunit [Pararhodobacter sp.]